MMHRRGAVAAILLAVAARAVAARAVAAQPVTASPPPAPPLAPAPPVLRGLYLNRFAVQSPTRLRRLVALADRTSINAFVLDMKDEFGLNYASRLPAVARFTGRAGVVRDLARVLDTLKAHGIVPIARVVAFKDPVAAQLAPEHVIRRPDGGTWRDKQGLAWVNPYAPAIQALNIAVGEELARLGFAEIQYDYVRFPEPFPSLPRQVFPGATVPKPALLARFLTAARGRIARTGARTTADVFGLAATLAQPLEVGQHWETLAPTVDVMLPMTYPSHFARGALGFVRPNAEPFGVQQAAAARAAARNAALGLTGERVRPWVQAFTLGRPPYGATEVAAQIRGIEAGGFRGWILWSPGSKYEPFAEALGPPDR